MINPGWDGARGVYDPRRWCSRTAPSAACSSEAGRIGIAPYEPGAHAALEPRRARRPLLPRVPKLALPVHRRQSRAGGAHRARRGRRTTEPFILHPGEFVLGSTLERVTRCPTTSWRGSRGRRSPLDTGDADPAQGWTARWRTIAARRPRVRRRRASRPRVRRRDTAALLGPSLHVRSCFSDGTTVDLLTSAHRLADRRTRTRRRVRQPPTAGLRCTTPTRSGALDATSPRGDATTRSSSQAPCRSYCGKANRHPADPYRPGRLARRRHDAPQAEITTAEQVDPRRDRAGAAIAGGPRSSSDRRASRVAGSVARVRHATQATGPIHANGALSGAPSALDWDSRAEQAHPRTSTFARASAQQRTALARRA